MKNYFSHLSQAEEFLFSRRARYFPGKDGLKRAQNLLQLLGNPQEKIKIIHTAGTSGKGSTAFILSQILKAAGFKVGLTVSPHLLNLRERIQINNLPLNEKEFLSALNQLMPIIKKLKKEQAPTFFEIITALAFNIFLQKKVDYAIVETGLGGKYDATNTVKNPQKIVILTKIGYDHTHILGKTLKEIAQQKAGVIQRGNLVIALKQKPAVNKVFLKTAQEKNAPLHFIEVGKNFKNITLSSKKTTFDYQFSSFSLSQVKLGLLGAHQAENAALAISAVYFLKNRDSFPLPPALIKKSLKHINLPGRSEIIKRGKKTIILDGAHNPQKLNALCKTLKNIFPKEKFVFLIAYKKNKNLTGCLKPLLPLAKEILITDFTGPAQKPPTIKKHLEKLGFLNSQIVKNPQEVIKKGNFSFLVITGSFYLLHRCYPFLLPKRRQRLL